MLLSLCQKDSAYYISSENCLKSKTTLEWWRSTLVKLQSNLNASLRK
ncbi:uncharacterized protein CELE_T25B2.4 [Caenorhabditis elegans]|uniref:Uncharacterized protein n=1 Tax=Caenorhabditis elegans TaxID=6239 RepID=D3NQ91_CAEEL|nr:Uncharacterized protein CELE_T25B2.4 [Caenorhabditis elegans]CCD66698.1 Uncharacterized protein CELE_T25B2.4 [Caenorhabditis elegans]|eukprot:NP_001257037.1 Uncharacterized protein CELE_T25B2.4 [Caenorhabditis elegans]